MASHTTGDGRIPPREATQDGLKRVMTLGGHYVTRNFTVKSLRDQKGKRVLVETLPFSVDEAVAAEEAGIDTMKVRFDPSHPELAEAIRAAAPNTFMAFSVPLVAAASETEAHFLQLALLRDVSVVGAGSGGDIQFLFADDILGNHPPPYPRHSKQYRNLYEMKQKMQLERVAGFKEFVDDVQVGRFPGPEHVIPTPEGLIKSFLEELDQEEAPL